MIVFMLTSLNEFFSQEDGISKNKMNAIICQALRQLKSEKTGTEKAWFMSLVTLAKLKSDLFTADKIVEVRFQLILSVCQLIILSISLK